MDKDTVLLIYCLIMYQAVFGPQKIFARTSFVMITSAALFAIMMRERSESAIVLASYVGRAGFLLAGLMVFVHLKWRVKCWWGTRRNGQK